MLEKLRKKKMLEKLGGSKDVVKKATDSMKSMSTAAMNLPKVGDAEELGESKKFEASEDESTETKKKKALNALFSKKR